MITLSGYKIENEIHRGAKTSIYRGQREQDSTPVVIKVLANEYPTTEEVARFRQEYEISNQLKFDGVVRSYALERLDNRLALVMEDTGGISLSEVLKREKIEHENFLKIGIKIADALADIHGRNIIHKDIKPGNIIINTNSETVKITGFGISAQISREDQSVKNPDNLEGTLAYMSPEQTGRMNRSIDFRSDFYSLGVLFYEMLTGVLPFRASDAMALVHSHIAVTPEEPEKLNPTTPKVLSEITMKLLSKTAEDRYQSARGIKADLERALESLEKTGKIEYFKPGERDLSDKLQIPQKLYGRTEEIKALLETFERVSDSQVELMLVAGYSGIGKSALVNEVHKPIVSHRGYFTAGKFDQFNRNIPYSALIQGFKSLIGELLTESEDQVAKWKEKLLEALGTVGQVIVDVLPEVEHIVGKLPPVPELGPAESLARFNLAFQKFIRVFADPNHPLVLFLDDLQWADSATLNLLQLSMNDPELKNLLIIGAYRDNEVDEYHPLAIMIQELNKSGATVNTISLQPLKFESVNELVSETVLADPSRTEELAHHVMSKTNGNPFFVNEFLKSLNDDGGLRFDPAANEWTWDMSRIQTMGITDNVVDLMAGKIQRLPEATQEALKMAACVGNKFDLRALSIVSQKEIEDTGKDLWKAIQEGLIIPLDETYRFMAVSDQGEELKELEKTGFKFLHDRVQQAAYTLISDEDKRDMHLKIGQSHA